MKLVQHVPGFADIGGKEARFTNKFSLCLIPFVLKWTIIPGFSRLSISTADASHPTLMAEYKDGSYYVVGYIEDFKKEQLAALKLPVWTDGNSECFHEETDEKYSSVRLVFDADGNDLAGKELEEFNASLKKSAKAAIKNKSSRCKDCMYDGSCALGCPRKGEY